MLTSPSPTLLRRSPLLAAILLILFIQSYFLFKYNAEASSNIYQDDVPAKQLVSTITSTVTVTSKDIKSTPAAANKPTPTQVKLSAPTATAVRGPELHDVVLSIKTGSTVLFARVPLQLLTIIPNFPQTLIYSDIKNKLGDWEILDALKDVSGDLADTSLSFRADLLNLHAQNAGLADHSGKMEDLKEGWALDKFKNVPMLITSYQKYPNASYYLFIDGDTSLVSSNFWPYLLQVTQESDPRTKPIYFGSVSYISDRPFAHGGSGYLLNQAAAQKVIPREKAYEETFLRELERKYTAAAAHECCGDLVLSLAVRQDGTVEVEHKWPFFQGESWWSIPFSDANFCEPMGTLHHVTPEDIQTIWDFEQTMLAKTGMKTWRPPGWNDLHEQGLKQWRFTEVSPAAANKSAEEYKYILFNDLYDYFLSQRLPWQAEKDENGEVTQSAIRVGWDNQSWREWELNEEKIGEEGTEQWKKDAIASEKNCRIACEKYYENCVQWYYRDGVCGLSDKVVYGRRLPNQGTYSEWKKLGVSGWVPRRMEAKIKEWKLKC
ncbi:hypothetical protein ABW19_dt0210580 [Dactylella cylindrospora]|nr:hypothetical protein ABW19_dt0210580 [Dactylella cylindrospora]